MIDPRNTRAVWFWIAGVLAVLLAARSLRLDSHRTVIVAFFELPLPELCSFRRTLGIDCPGCGLTRSFILASRLRVVEAWQMNAAGSLLFASLMISIPFRFIQWILAKRGINVRSTLRLEAGWLVVLTCIMVVSWALRILT